MNRLSAGVIATANKKHERRLPIHPEHLAQIPAELRQRLVFERGYGANFGVSDEALAQLSGGVASREEVLQRELVVLAKPTARDLQQMAPNGILWGWAHCVQNRAVVQAAIDRKLTLITWEAMNTWGADGRWRSHTFMRNNEIAGYAGVVHALPLRGLTGHYGPVRKAVVINLGSVGQGAVRALTALGFGDITIVLKEASAVAERFTTAKTVLLDAIVPDQLRVSDAKGAVRPLIDLLGEADVIVNAILQDTDRPLTFVRDEELPRLKNGALILDISCDTGMGFPRAAPTNFDQPIRQLEQVYYYAVDHTPSFLWNSATWEISAALLPFLDALLRGPEAWKLTPTIQRAIEMRDGVIVNPKIFSFQRRKDAYPHVALQ
jgi:alanine dehydrogenase